MREKKQGPKDVPVSERMGQVATAPAEVEKQRTMAYDGDR